MEPDKPFLSLSHRVGLFQGQARVQGHPETFPLLLPLQGLLRKNFNSKAKFTGILTLREGDFAPPARFVLQEKEAPSTAHRQPLHSRSMFVKIYSHQGKSAVKNKRGASKPTSDQDQR